MSRGRQRTEGDGELIGCVLGDWQLCRQPGGELHFVHIRVWRLSEVGSYSRQILFQISVLVISVVFSHKMMLWFLPLCKKHFKHFRNHEQIKDSQNSLLLFSFSNQTGREGVENRQVSYTARQPDWGTGFQIGSQCLKSKAGSSQNEEQFEQVQQIIHWLLETSKDLNWQSGRSGVPGLWLSS